MGSAVEEGLFLVNFRKGQQKMYQEWSLQKLYKRAFKSAAVIVIWPA
jgi:hypothetical protein